MTLHPYTRLFAMSGDPTTGDDSSDGYEVGDVWVTPTKSWQCLDSSVGAAIWLDLTAGGPGGSAHTIQDEGTPLTARTNLNFTGGGVTVTDDAGNDATDVDIPAASTTEEIQDIVADMMTESGGIGISYDDVNAEILFDVLTPSNAAYAKIDGWETPAGSQSYSSADSPIFVISFAADMTGTIYPGVRIKLTQTTVKYFIVVAVGAYSGGVTLVTVYGGTDYTLANAAIASLQYSYMKCPRGFPVEADKWTTKYTDTTNLNVGGPANNTYYNPGGAAYAFPLGKWKLYYNWTATLTVTTTAVRTLGLVSALSTATGSVSDMELRMSQQVMGPVGACGIILIATRSKLLNLASKTTYYPIVLASVVTDAITTVGIRGDLNTTVITLECAYL